MPSPITRSRRKRPSRSGTVSASGEVIVDFVAMGQMQIVDEAVVQDSLLLAFASNE